MYADAGALEYGATTPGSCPAMSPAMNVPCPFVSRLVRFGDWDSSERSGPLTTWPGLFSPSTGETPVSMTATSTP
jgi:hypothetical protein